MAIGCRKLRAYVPVSQTNHRPFDKEATVGLICLPIANGTVPINQAGVAFAGIVIPIDCEVVAVSSWARAKAGAPTVMVTNSGTNLLTAGIAPAVAGAAPQAGTLVASRITRRIIGSAGAVRQIQVVWTTGGADTVTDALTTIWLRPWPVIGESQ